MGSPAIGTSDLPGNLVDPQRAGMAATTEALLSILSIDPMEGPGGSQDQKGNSYNRLIELNSLHFSAILSQQPAKHVQPGQFRQ
jgi:hypothetical protein